MDYITISPTKDEARYSENKLKIFNNEELGISVRTMMNPDGSICVNAEDAAIGFGWTTVAKSGNEVVRWARFNDYCKEIGFSPQVGKDDFIPESLFYRLGMKANNATAEKFQNWLAMDVIPSIRKNGTYSTQPVLPVINDLSVIKFVADDLRVSEEGRISMYHNYCESIGMTTSFLPQYIDNGNRERCSATELLKRNGCELSTAKFNQQLLEYGFLEEKERPSSSKGTKKFKSLTEKGLEYGVNLICQKNQKETQPYYYADTFMKLYNMVA